MMNDHTSDGPGPGRSAQVHGQRGDRASCSTIYSSAFYGDGIIGGLLLYVHGLLVNCCGDYKRLCCSCKVLKIFIKGRIYIGLPRLESETDAEILRLFAASLQDDRLLTVGQSYSSL